MESDVLVETYPWLWAHDGCPRIYGHRGTPRVHPENTVDGFLAALAHGADGIEFDVHVSRDGIPVIAHDPTLRRTHGENVTIASQPARHLPLPRLDDVLRAVRSRYPHRHLDIELKVAYPPDKLIDLLDETGGTDGVTVGSFEADVVATYRTQSDLATAFIFDDRRIRAPDVLRLIEKHDPHAIALHNPIFLATVVSAVHEAGRGLWLWTLNRRAHMQRAVRFGVDAIITDLPGTAISVLEGKGTPPAPGL